MVEQHCTDPHFPPPIAITTRIAFFLPLFLFITHLAGCYVYSSCSIAVVELHHKLAIGSCLTVIPIPVDPTKVKFKYMQTQASESQIMTAPVL